MRNLLLWVASIALIAFQVPSANATPVVDFDWSYTCPTCGTDYTSGTGEYITTPEGGGVYLITSIVVFTGGPLSLLPVDSYLSNDNLLYYPGTPYFYDAFGFAGVGSGTTFDVSCTSDGCVSTTATAVSPITLTVSPTPLPSTWLMLLGGFVGLGFFAYRGMKNNSAALAAA